MDIATHLDILRADGELLADTAEHTGLDAPVPSCPDWRIRDLLAHLGGVHRWAAFVVRSGSITRPSREDTTALFQAPGDGELLDWYRTTHADLLKALTTAAPDTRAWTFFEAPSAIAFWARRQAHETAVHRVDAELAAGRPSTVPAEFAADGIDELLTGFLSRPGRNLVADPPLSIAIAPDDDSAAWTMRIATDGRRVESGAGPADLTVSGPAENLYLLLWNRADTTGCRLAGDPEVMVRWHELATVD
ncbi:maleylpyruvate isomerase family mycothiol-dependent enzyme [Embleya scabrispora]|uniref:maleylpyruvate isomerase family mycothiol-dependent enzyme n=1 Tax=Embleya scabrispora TaxID=159449 RepID=UPI00037E4A70|nr:maleylpyruvate isomerase family mycothiol-dependent enzyme [Embleya scabrispora]MYS84200.1 maleylpyruvate isomerase family mycothiol-dependent enzyme [Streptomyces sp. SID5474]